VLDTAFPSLQRRSWLIAGFAPIVLFALGADSRLLYQRGLDGQLVSNLAAPLYFLWVLSGLRPEQRLMAIVFVPFSALGEGLFSLVFGLYTYKSGAVPFYVPFGHAILFSTGLMITELPGVAAREAQVRWGLVAFHAALFGGAALALGDTLSAIFGALFLLILRRKGCRVFYLIMGVLVLYIELVGTALGCWFWEPAPFGVLRTTNPPVGAFVCYVIADILVIKIAGRLAPLLARARLRLGSLGREDTRIYGRFRAETSGRALRGRLRGTFSALDRRRPEGRQPPVERRSGASE
jgi:hypothetical protein